MVELRRYAREKYLPPALEMKSGAVTLLLWCLSEQMLEKRETAA